MFVLEIVSGLCICILATVESAIIENQRLIYKQQRVKSIIYVLYSKSLNEISFKSNINFFFYPPTFLYGAELA